MEISINKALDGFASFAANDVIAAMPNGMPKFLALMAVGAMKTNPWALLKPYESVLKSIGAISEDGKTVNVDLLRDSMASAFSAMPKVSFMGFTFTAEDADRLLERMEA